MTVTITGQATAVLLSGTVGSTAYGLSTADSDVDTLGVYAAPTIAFHGLHPPRDSIVTTNPDSTLHEAGKYARLALQGNPTVMELMWLGDYNQVTLHGYELINIREAFLSARRVRAAYLGYATSQFARLRDRGDGSFSADTRKRTAKHARHLHRLCLQGFALYTTGRLPIVLDPANVRQVFEFGEQVAAGDVDVAARLIARYESMFDDATPAVPEHPDVDTVEAWLLRVRNAHFRAAA